LCNDWEMSDDDHDEPFRMPKAFERLNRLSERIARMNRVPEVFTPPKFITDAWAVANAANVVHPPFGEVLENLGPLSQLENLLPDHSRLFESLAAHARIVEALPGSTQVAHEALGFPALAKANLWGLGHSIDQGGPLASLMALHEVTAPWAELAALSRRVLGYLPDDEFGEEQVLWLPDDEPVDDQTFRELLVPNTVVPVVQGTVHLSAMAALLRDPSAFQHLDPRQFELVVAELLTALGYLDIQLTPRSADGGKDIVAHRLIGGRPSVVYFECKHYKKGLVGFGEVLTLFGAISSDRVPHGVMVTSAKRLTRGGLKLVAKHSDRLDAKVHQDLVGWVQTYARKRGR
jgi:hypothetical protein